MFSHFITFPCISCILLKHMRKKLNVKVLRKYLDLTQDEIAAKYSLSRTAWSNYERSNSFPETLIQNIESDFKEKIEELGSKVQVNEVSESTIAALQVRINDLEDLLKQKDTLIANQLAIIELQNQTIQALKK